MELDFLGLENFQVKYTIEYENIFLECKWN